MGKLKGSQRRMLMNVGFDKKQGARKSSTEVSKKFLITKELKQKFYESQEWSTIKLWASKRFKKVCFCCFSSENIQLDHIKPISRSPINCLNFRNVQYLCSCCNQIKSNISKKKFRKIYQQTKNDSFMPAKEDIELFKSKWVKFFPPV